MISFQYQSLLNDPSSGLTMNLAWFMAVKSIFLYIGLHLAGDEIPHRPPPFDHLPDFCRRDIKNRDLLKVEGMTRRMDPTLDVLIITENSDQGLWKWGVGIPVRPAGGDSYRGRKGLLRSRTGHHNEVAKGEKVLKFLPSLYLHKRIPS